MPSALAVDDSYVYWAERDGMSTSRIVRAPKVGGQATVMASGQQPTEHLVVDAVSVIWATVGPGNSIEGNIVRLAK